MTPEIAKTYYEEFLPLIAGALVDPLPSVTSFTVIPAIDAMPAYIQFQGTPAVGQGKYRHHRNVVMMWNHSEIERLVCQPGNKMAHFRRTIAARLADWQDAQRFDLATNSQNSPSQIVISDLDFEDGVSALSTKESN